MIEELINYKTARLARQAGFDISCQNTFDVIDNKVFTNMSSMGGMIDTCQRPTQSLLQRWIREVYEIHMYPTRCKSKTKYSWVIFEDDRVSHGEKWKTYELALEQALQKALTIIINRKDVHLS